MKKIILLNKKEGQTSLEALESFRQKNKAYQNLPLTYAGRLDPLAEGLLLVLAGEKTKQKEKYLKLSKEYSFNILFGFATDTFDVLGKITKKGKRKITQEQLEKNLKFFRGKFLQEYPSYSSKTVKGKPLFSYARDKEKVKLPQREVFVSDLKFFRLKKITGDKLLEKIEKKIQKVQGDFRQKEILKIWQKNLISSENVFWLADFEIKCGSGTYVRALANDLGKKIGVPALAFSIKRTKIGKWCKI